MQDLFKSEGLAEKLGGKIAYKSDGVPYFVIELVRGLRDSSLLKQLPNGSYIQTEQITDIEVPSAVKDLIAGRLRELTKDERAILDIQPHRVKIVRAPSSGDVATVLAGLGVPEDDLQEIANLNGRALDDQVELGDWLKIVH